MEKTKKEEVRQEDMRGKWGEEVRQKGNIYILKIMVAYSNHSDINMMVLSYAPLLCSSPWERKIKGNKPKSPERMKITKKEAPKAKRRGKDGAR